MAVQVGVGVFVLAAERTPQFLVGKRINSHGDGTIALPGGHLEFGESFEECAAREVLEETGLKVKDIKFLTATNDVMPADNKHYITVFMTCVRAEESAEAQNLEPHKCEGWEWIDWQTLVQWVREDGTTDGEGVRRAIFTPLVSLIRQRPGVMPTMV